MGDERLTANTSLATGFGLALLGTTCCALPVVLVTLGLGSVVASVASVLPWLVWLSQYKSITFSATALVLVYSWWQLRCAGRSEQCAIGGGKRLKWQRRVLAVNTVIFGAAVFAAYALLPVTLWLEGLAGSLI